MDTFEKFLTEASLSRVWQHVSNPDIAVGVITAFRGTYDLQTNKQRNAQLASEVRAAGYGFFIVQGSYVENKGTPDEKRVKEDSLFIVGNPKDGGRLKHLLTGLMKKYDQEAVLYKAANAKDATLLNADGSSFSVGEFHPNRVGDFMTQLVGRPGSFVFEGVEEPGNWLSRWARSK